MVKKIIFVPTWRCQLKCSYCDYRIDKDGKLHAFDKIKNIGRELEWFEWVQYLDRFEPLLLEMTGGEPTMYKDLNKLLLHLSGFSRWAITSNTLNRDAIKKLPAYNCHAWTASYHYHSDDDFMTNLFILRGKGIMPRVTIVITPENYNVAKEKIKMFQVEGYGVNIHPVLKQDFDWAEHRDVWDGIKGLADGAQTMIVGDISDKWMPERHEMCSAGGDYFCLMPDGQVLRCYSQILTDDHGVFIKDFEPVYEARPCSMDCMFPCDRQIANKTRG